MKYVNKSIRALIGLVAALHAGFALAQVKTIDPAFMDSDGDTFGDGPDTLIEINSKRYILYGEDTNGNGKFEPNGADDKPGTKDDEFDPNDPTSHPAGPWMEKAPEGMPILKPERPPIPSPSENTYYFFATMDHDQIVESQERYSKSRGLARLTMNTETKIINYSIGFCGLTNGGEEKARIMGPAPRGEAAANAPRYLFAKGLEKNGEWHYAEGKESSEIAEFEQNLKAGLFYIDIVAAGYPDGELRGQIDIDRDCDGLADYQETEDFHTDPLDRDSDDDGLYDGEEALGLGRLQGYRRAGLMDYYRITEEIEAGTSDSQPSDLSKLSMKLVTILDPNRWDTDHDGLADGLELGVTSAILGFVQDGIVVQGTQFPDVDSDGIHDSLGYRLIDLGPDEPNTNPIIKDTNRNGSMDGDDDSNRNGRIDRGEEDPVRGFYSDTGDNANKGVLVLGFEHDTPYGDCYYMKTAFNFGSMPEGRLTIVEPEESEVHIVPRVLVKGTDGKASVEFYIPAKQRVEGKMSIMAVIGAIPASVPVTTPIPSPMELAKVIQH